MAIIETPPTDWKKHRNILTKPLSPSLKRLIEDINTRYDYWTKVKYKQPLPEGISHEELWHYVKASRLRNKTEAWARYCISFPFTDYMQSVCHQIDMGFGAYSGAEETIPTEGRERYLVASLIEEAISSSQMEGASTTRRVAKEMLRKGTHARTKSERMILNNYKTIQFIKDNKDKALSKELLLEVQRLMTKDTLEHEADAGRLRNNEDYVVVENSMTQEVVHTPPPSEDLEDFVEDLCTFFNARPTSATPFIHPLLRGIIVHFMLAYMHPFVDGNGRTARALFYWYMLRQGYPLTEYLSISSVIARSKRQYEQAYLYTEHDEHDLGYFITYHLRVIEQAFARLKQYIERKQREQASAHTLLEEGLNLRQAEILGIYKQNPSAMLTVRELQSRFGISPTTAKSDLLGLVERGYIVELALNKVKRGYILKEKGA